MTGNIMDWESHKDINEKTIIMEKEKKRERKPEVHCTSCGAALKAVANPQTGDYFGAGGARSSRQGPWNLRFYENCSLA